MQAGRIFCATMSCLIAASSLPVAVGQTRNAESAANANIKPPRQNDRGGFQEHVLTEDGRQFPYQVWLPPNYTPDRNWPLVVFLHGAGERGDDGQKPTQVGLGPALRRLPDRFPCVVLFPQCELSERPILEGWAADQPASQRLSKILQQTKQRYAVDSKRQILTGWSMGGYGVWQVASAWPDRWSALLPISSGGTADMAARLPDVPIWAISGQRDNVVRPSAVQPVLKTLQQRQQPFWHTVVPYAGHDVWQTAYFSPEVQSWLMNPTNRGSAPELKADRPATSVTQDFRPVLQIPEAVGVRIGNRMLEAVSYAIPKRIPPAAISGRIPNIHDTTSASGIQFAVTFSGINYTGRVTDASLQAAGTDRLSLAVALRDVNLTIGSTFIRGGRKSATAGPISIGIGTRRPVWLKIEARPYVKDRRLKLSVLNSEFRIDRDNWYVTRPYGVATRGWGMTQSRVSDALVEGLYARRGRIENEVKAAVPSILGWVEDVIDFSSAGAAAAAVWPLPVYQPKARAWPQDVSVDADGITLTLGLDVAAPTDQPLEFRKASTRRTIATALRSRSQSTLSVAIDPTILQPMSQLLVESNVARINVLDIPGDAFAELTDREKLASVVPSLQTLPVTTEIRTELVLPAPLQLRSVVDGSQDQLLLAAPTARLQVASRPHSVAAWQSETELNLALQQLVSVSVESQEEFSNVKVIPQGDVQVAAVESIHPEPESGRRSVNQTRLLNLFADTWNSWLNGQALNEAVLPSLDFQQTRLLLRDIYLQDEAILAAFAIPPIRIRNLTDREHRYQVKSPSGRWSETRVLPAGDFHRYDVEYSLTYRWTQNGKPTIYTLKPGSRSEFRIPVAGGEPTLFRKRTN